jgi:hypothetical protein
MATSKTLQAPLLRLQDNRDTPAGQQDHSPVGFVKPISEIEAVLALRCDRVCVTAFKHVYPSASITRSRNGVVVGDKMVDVSKATDFEHRFLASYGFVEEGQGATSTLLSTLTEDLASMQYHEPSGGRCSHLIVADELSSARRFLRMAPESVQLAASYALVGLRVGNHPEIPEHPIRMPAYDLAPSGSRGQASLPSLSQLEPGAHYESGTARVHFETSVMLALTARSWWFPAAQQLFGDPMGRQAAYATIARLRAGDERGTLSSPATPLSDSVIDTMLRLAPGWSGRFEDLVIAASLL